MDKDSIVSKDQLDQADVLRFVRRKKRLLFILVAVEILSYLLAALQGDVGFREIFGPLLYLSILFLVMWRTWKAGLLLWIEMPGNLITLASWQYYLDFLSVGDLFLSVRVILGLFSAAVSIFTTVWLTLVPKNRRYSEMSLGM